MGDSLRVMAFWEAESEEHVLGGIGWRRQPLPFGGIGVGRGLRGLRRFQGFEEGISRCGSTTISSAVVLPVTIGSTENHRESDDIDANLQRGRRRGRFARSRDRHVDGYMPVASRMPPDGQALECNNMLHRYVTWAGSGWL